MRTNIKFKSVNTKKKTGFKSIHDFVSLAAGSLSLLSCSSKLTNQCAQKALSLV